jgi:8-oxo-dGTP diphosphatase
MVFLDLEDDQYEYEGYTHTRLIVGGVVIDRQRRFALHHLFRDDVFGKADYFEIPGGGVKENENIEEALKRECLEELGAKISIIAQLGIVNDAYNLIKRKNENHYFICSLLEKGDPHFESQGDLLIKETLWVGLDEGIALLKGHKDVGVPELVKARELPILLEAKRLFEASLVK